MPKQDLSLRNARILQIRTSIHIIHHINKSKKKNHIIICRGAKMAFLKIQIDLVCGLEATRQGDVMGGAASFSSHGQVNLLWGGAELQR